MSIIIAAIIGFSIAPLIWFAIGVPLLLWNAFTPAFFDNTVDKFCVGAPWWRVVPACAIMFLIVLPGMAIAAAGKIVHGGQH